MLTFSILSQWLLSLKTQGHKTKQKSDPVLAQPYEPRAFLFVKASLFEEEGPIALHSLNLPTSCHICPTYIVFFLLCSPHAQRSFLKYLFPRHQILISQVNFHNRNQRTKATWKEKFRKFTKPKKSTFHSYREASNKIHASMQTLEHR